MHNEVVGNIGSDGPDNAYHDGQIFDEIYPALRRFAATVGAIDQDPDDLVQEALARTLRRTTLRELDSPTGYLRRTIVRLAADSRRSAWRRQGALKRLASLDAMSQQFPSDLCDLDQLSATDRAVLYLTDIEAYTHLEAAALLGLSHNAVRTRASRARRQLKAILEDDKVGGDQ
jgi:RNA polymerase sigma-70 factor, ECF subfamily